MDLQTERLLLRRWKESDAENLFRYASDPDVGPICGWPPHQSTEESLFVIQNVLSGPECYAICLKEDQKAIGCIELRLNGSTDMTDRDDECELGYWLGKPFWGRGIMPEAAQEMIRHAFEDLGMEKIWCGYYDGNHKSRRCQEKCGFQYQWTTEGLDVPKMHETRTGHVNLLTREAWTVRKTEVTNGTERGLNDPATVRNQYSTADKLNTRISIHSRYSTNKQGFGNWITSHYQIREGMSVLELGCGTGDMWTGKQDIIRRCSVFILSDFSEGMLNRAKETLRDDSGIEYRVIDIQDIPFEDGTFDVVIANMMLYHVPDLSRGLREVRRVLKKNGSFYCATYGENGMMEYICSLFRDYQVQNQGNRNFTLQNGEEKLHPFFQEIKTFLYEDALEVTDVEDLVDYIFSLTGMSDLQKIPRDEVRMVLEKNMRDGMLHVPKEYGMFIAE